MRAAIRAGKHRREMEAAGAVLADRQRRQPIQRTASQREGHLQHDAVADAQGAGAGPADRAQGISGGAGARGIRAVGKVEKAPADPAGTDRVVDGAGGVKDSPSAQPPPSRMDKKAYQATGPFSTCFAECAGKRFAGWRRRADLGGGKTTRYVRGLGLSSLSLNSQIVEKHTYIQGITLFISRQKSRRASITEFMETTPVKG